MLKSDKALWETAILPVGINGGQLNGPVVCAVKLSHDERQVGEEMWSGCETPEQGGDVHQDRHEQEDVREELKRQGLKTEKCKYICIYIVLYKAQMCMIYVQINHKEKSSVLNIEKYTIKSSEQL